MGSFVKPVPWAGAVVLSLARVSQPLLLCLRFHSWWRVLTAAAPHRGGEDGRLIHL